MFATITHAMHGSASAKRQCYEQLIGAEHGWLHACREALTHGHRDWLSLQEPSPLWWAWHLVGDLCERDELCYPAIASAIAACARVAATIQCLAPVPVTPAHAALLREQLLDALQQWQQSHPNYPPATHEHAPPCADDDANVSATPVSPAQLVSVFLTAIQPCYPAGCIAAVRDLIGFFCTGTCPPAPTTQQVPVLLDVGPYGVVADLYLQALPDGVGACYADPCTMAFFHGDAAFFAALDTAQHYVRQQGGGDFTTDVRWHLVVRPTVQHPHRTLPAVAGGSLGVGFAVGMTQLLDPQQPPLDPAWAMTGRLAPNGDVLPVAGYPAKIDTARDHRLRVIVPAASLPMLRQYWQDSTPHLHLRGAATLYEACEHARQHASAHCPYRGLAAFTEADAEHFFGRRRLLATLLTALREQPRVLALFGPSGSGKSSLVQAGLLPSLRGGALPGSAQWELRVVRPADDPIGALAAAGLAGPSLIHAIGDWRAMHPHAPHLLLVLDQFEEVLLSCPTVLRQHFLEHLSDVLDQPDLPLTIVLVMRDDFYSRLNQQAPELMPRVVQSLINIPATLNHDELVSIVQEPAASVGWDFESGLVQLIAHDVHEASHGVRLGSSQARATLLPLLEFALTQLWAQSRDGLLTHEAYQAIGGVTGALTNWATTAFEQLGPTHQQIARRIFTDLVYLGDEGQGLPDSRRRRRVPELALHAAEREHVLHVIQSMTTARLLVTARDRLSGDETVELIHETLVSEWLHLRQWIAEDRRFLAGRQLLERRSTAWHSTALAPDATRDMDLLLRGRELDEAAHWLTQYASRLTHAEQTYIRASLHQRATEHRQHAHQRWWQRVLLVALLSVLVIFAGSMFWQWQRTQDQLAISESRRIALAAREVLERDPELALLLAIEAAQLDQNAEVESMLHQVLQINPLQHVGRGHTGTVTALAFNHATRQLVTASTDGTARLWNVQTGELIHVFRGHRDIVNDATFSADGQWLVTASGDRTARIWDARTGALRQIMQGHAGTLVRAAFSPDGQWLVTASGLDARASVTDRSARLWHVQTGKPVHLLSHGGSVADATFSPDGRWVLTASSDTVARLWDVTTGTVVREFAHPAPVSRAQFSRDGLHIVTVADDDVVRIWDPATGAISHTLTHSSNVFSVAISPDARWIVTGDGDGMLHRWDVLREQRIQSVRAHAGLVKDVVFSSDGFLLATASSDQTFRLWRLQGAEELVTLRGHQGAVQHVTFSPDGQYLVSAGADRTVRVWERATGAAVRVLHGHTAAVNSAVVSPDGQLIVSASDDATLRVWDVTTGASVAVLVGHTAPIRSVAYAPDGQQIVSVGNDNAIHLWDAQTYQGQRVFATQPSNLLQVAFMPDPRYLVTVGQDYLLRVWQRDTGAVVWQIQAHEAAINAVASSPDGRLLATGSADTTVRIWDWRAAQLMRQHAEPAAAVTSVEFSPDGRALMAASADGQVRQWMTQANASPVQLWHGDVQINDSCYSPDQRYVAIASAAGPIHLGYATFTDTLALAQTRTVRELTAAERMTYLRTASESRR